FTMQSGQVDVSDVKVTWVGGTQFSPAWVRQPGGGWITIGRSNYAIQSVDSNTSLTLESSAGSEKRMPYLYALQTNSNDPGAVLAKKIEYAKARWNASLFYVDSNLSWDGTVNGASYFQNLLRAFPGILVFPEWS